MKKFLLTLLISATTLMAFAQQTTQNWKIDYGLPQQYYNTNAFRAFDANTLYCASTRGTFSKTLDGGKTWRSTQITDVVLYGLYFYDKNNGWASDYNGGIFHTTDAGETWEYQATGLNTFLFVGFSNATTAWVLGADDIGGAFLKTTDGGDTWSKVNLPDNRATRFSRIQFVDEKIGYLLGSGTQHFLYKTIDGGDTWTLLSDPDKKGGTFNVMHFLNPQVGYISDQFSGFIYKTIDGGETWVKLSGIAALGTIQNFAFLSESIGYTSDDQGNIFKTTDGGSTWSQQKSTVPSGTINALSFVNQDVGFAGSLFHTLRTTDGGANWKRIGDEFVNFSSVFSTENEVFAVGPEGKIVKKSAGAWEKQVSNTSEQLNDVRLHRGKGWIAGNKGTLLQTNNGGTTWTAAVTNTKENLNALYFTNENAGWAVGDVGTILRTADGGTTWSPISGVTDKNLRQVFFVNDSIGWASGSNGTLLQYKNTSWTTLKSGVTAQLNGLFFLDAMTGYAVGAENKILKTVDGGITWAAQTSPLAATVVLNAVYFIDANNGWIVGTTGAILRTTDGGLNWKKINMFNFPIGDVHFSGAKNGWIAGNGFILNHQSVPNLEFQGIPAAPALTFNYANKMPSFKVNVLNEDGSIDNTYNGQITLQKSSGGGAITGTLVKSAVNGTAVFDDLKVSRPSIYTLEAATPTIRTNSFTFTARTIAADTLVFVRVKETIAVDSIIPTFIVAAMDSLGYGSGATYTNKPITIAVLSGPGTISGTLVKTSSSGIASFNNIRFSTPGTYVLSASDGTINTRSIKIIVTGNTTGTREKETTISSVQSFPNPFRQATTFIFDLKENSNVWFFIYNTAGQEISKLHLGNLKSGKNEYQWNAPTGIVPGMYIYQIRTDKGTYAGKLQIHP